MVRTKGGVQSKHSDITTYAGRNDVEMAYYSGKNKNSTWISYRPRNFAWYESYNNAIALYRYMLTRDNYNYEDTLTETGTIYDEIIDSFKESELVFDSNYNSDGFNAGKNHAVRIIRLKNKEIKFEYLNDYDDSNIISDFENYLNSSKKVGGR